MIFNRSTNGGTMGRIEYFIKEIITIAVIAFLYVCFRIICKIECNNRRKKIK
ncbi:hypothetical protein KKG24_04885 [Patescibacteria group bacterium]|nr:hypothetical protein [Patescibacteria group bacterium]